MGRCLLLCIACFLLAGLPSASLILLAAALPLSLVILPCALTWYSGRFCWAAPIFLTLGFILIPSYFLRGYFLEIGLAGLASGLFAAAVQGFHLAARREMPCTAWAAYGGLTVLYLFVSLLDLLHDALFTGGPMAGIWIAATVCCLGITLLVFRAGRRVTFYPAAWMVVLFALQFGMTYWTLPFDLGRAALHFAGTTGSADARNAVEPLLEEGLSPQLDTSLQHSSGALQRQSAVFTLNENRSHPALQPRGTAGSYLLVAALQDMGFVHRHAVQTVVQYGAIWFTGTLLLAIISWRLTGKALAPTALAMRRQKEFIAAAGHELRSPLAVVKASLDAACRTPVTERATLLRNAEQETDRMARLVEDLLVLANGDLDALPAHLHPIAPDNLCLEVYDAFFPLAQQRQHPLSLTLPEDSVPSIEADPDRVKQLLAILLNNAFDHTPAGTPVELCLTYCGEKITLAVQDHGPGIPDAEKARVFDRFYSADPSRTDKHNFGLGLSVAKELARLHHADLTVTDTPGGGAKFAVTFAARIS